MKMKKMNKQSIFAWSYGEYTRASFKFGVFEETFTCDIGFVFGSVCHLIVNVDIDVFGIH